MATFTRFIGVDFSGARPPLSNLWAAAGEAGDDGGGGRLVIRDLRPLPFREDLRDWLTGRCREAMGWGEDEPVLVGLDFPFALPMEAVEALPGTGDWPGVVRYLASLEPKLKAVPPPLGAFTGAMRECDRRAGAMSPLNLRLFRQTIEGCRLLHELTTTHRVSIAPQAVTDSPTTLIEVYPSAAAKDLGIRAGNRPRKPREVFARAAGMEAYVRFEPPQLAAVAAGLEDAWDACLAAVNAFIVRDDLDQPTRKGDPARAAVEGWIYRHPEA